jgi:hypothetical protein
MSVDRAALIATVAVGLLAATVTDVLLVSVAPGRFVGPPLGVLALPALALLAVPAVRRTLSANLGWTLLVIGAAWTAAPVIDQHLTGAVVIGSAAADLVHHLAGWTALAAGSKRLSLTRSRTPRTTR